MAFYPTSAVGLGYIGYPAGPGPNVITLTADAAANTKGGYTEIVASSPFAANAVHVFVRSTVAAAGRNYLFDISVGAAASEVDIIPNLPAEGTTTNSSRNGHANFFFRVQIPASSRIAARCQASTGSDTMGIHVRLTNAGGVEGCPSPLVNYGADTTATGGTAIDAGATANVKGVYSELSASTSAVLQWMSVIAIVGHSNVLFCDWLVDLATGAAASEVVLIPDMMFNIATSGAGTETKFSSFGYDFLTYIAASTRLAARCSCTRNDNPDRILDLVVVGGVAGSESGGGGGSSEHAAAYFG